SYGTCPAAVHISMSDFRAALRALQKSPAFTLVAVITIAVGIGANTTLFSVYDRLVLNPVRLPQPSTLVAIWVNNTQLNFNAPAVAWSRYEQLRDHAQSFSSIGISAFRNFTASEDLPNGPAVCIISHELWQTRFGGRDQVLGSTIILNGQPWDVVGI